ncbi:MAG: hypothetical protein JRF72_09810 [Deltaproteobacteria bacterium]|jgi:hypothetical protein|nr:hypothetical protein [Deltaproteobacteria bacterium]
MRDPTSSIKMFSMGVVIFAVLIGFLPPVYGQKKSVTEGECALRKGAEIIWDLRIYQWICCIPKGEYLEDCVPISDKAPLPKTSTKPLPVKGSGGIIKLQEPKNQTD